MTKENININDYPEALLFIPLGGAQEIGMNVNVFICKDKNSNNENDEFKILIVDCGAGFSSGAMPGIDMMVADISFLKKHKSKIVGLILTHAHEDHLGGVQYLWNELECPIYATRFTANFLKKRLSEYTLPPTLEIHEVEFKSRLDLAPFNIEFAHLTHSAPEMQALMIRTPVGNVLHTGDWKFDPEPVVGSASDEELLAKFGKEGVSALICDSTNVFNPGISGSEGELRRSLVDIIAGCKKMVVVTTFASNLARLDTLIHAAESAGRKVVLTGRSLHRIYEAAQDSGYLLDVQPFVDERDIGRFKKEELLIIATGCQGEPMAAVSKMSAGIHNNIKLSPGDTVIFSSKIIPGNDKRIFGLFNSLVKHKVEVITERDHFVHVSGHPSIEELKKMYELIKPKIAIPVHGERVHLHEHVKLARGWGVKHAIEVENGSVVEIKNEAAEIIGKVQSGYLGVDGNYLLPMESNVLKARRRLNESGIVFITVVLGRNSALVTRPVVSTPGCLDRGDDGQLISALRSVIIEELNNHRSGKLKIKHENIENIIKTTVRRFIKTEIGKTPMIDVNIEYLSGQHS